MHLDPAVVQRIERALNFEKPDRTPIWESLQHQGAYDHFAPGVPFPECAAIACARLGIDATYGCMAAVSGERTEGTNVIAGQTLWCTAPRFRSLDDLRAYEPDGIGDSELEERILQWHHHEQEIYAPHVMILPQSGGWDFLPGYDTETFTVVALAMHQDLPALERFWDLRTGEAVRRNSVTAKHRLAPVIQCCVDVAYKNGLMVSPGLLRDHFFPRFKRIIAPLKNAGIKVIWHSDGNIMDVLDDALECGIDGIDPVDPSAGMSIREIRRLYGKKPILVGNVGQDHCLRFGSPDDVRRDVDRCIRESGCDGGLLLQSGDGQVMPDTPLENLIAYCDRARAGC